MKDLFILLFCFYVFLTKLNNWHKNPPETGQYCEAFNVTNCMTRADQNKNMNQNKTEMKKSPKNMLELKSVWIKLHVTGLSEQVQVRPGQSSALAPVSTSTLERQPETGEPQPSRLSNQSPETESKQEVNRMPTRNGKSTSSVKTVICLFLIIRRADRVRRLSDRGSVCILCRYLCIFLFTTRGQQLLSYTVKILIHPSPSTLTSVSQSAHRKYDILF